MKITRAFLLPLLLFATILGGCLEVEQHYTINPDGSGKVELETFVTDWTLDAKDRNLKQRLREMALEVIDSAQGVEVWKDVHYELSGGRFHFKGTAYFRDLSAFKSKSVGAAPLRYVRSGETARLFLELQSSSSLTGETPSETSEPELDSAEIERQIDSLVGNLDMMKGMMGAFLDKFRVHTSLTLPASTTGIEGFTLRKNRYEFELTGAAILAAMDSVLSNRALLRQAMSERNRENDAADNAMRRAIFPNGIPSATISATAPPLFDYAREVGAARKEHEKILKELRKN